ncbi:hypothetical protein [Streptomyces sp. TRM70350]|uniref:hypothetical protein n=1 Tax=Streptomyces sp. TRM70350 TaxID=2856165 RepID=UPI001C46D731|nr:hypothetical protein [Streptomyces sp. TRM70350]MBV7696738.1 hypothetical protein [Streptomyces sp. TRM70350]
MRFDPLAAPTRYRPGLTTPATLRVWPMGEDEYAKPVAAALSNVPAKLSYCRPSIKVVGPWRDSDQYIA